MILIKSLGKWKFVLLVITYLANVHIYFNYLKPLMYNTEFTSTIDNIGGVLIMIPFVIIGVEYAAKRITAVSEK